MRIVATTTVDRSDSRRSNTLVRYGPEQTRQLITRDGSATVLAVGAMPGKAYTPPAFTELAAAD
jgi:hypothetical protein